MIVYDCQLLFIVFFVFMIAASACVEKNLDFQLTFDVWADPADESVPGWWWLEHDFYDFNREYIIIPIDELIFFRGVA